MNKIKTAYRGNKNHLKSSYENFRNLDFCILRIVVFVNKQIEQKQLRHDRLKNATTKVDYHGKSRIQNIN